MFVKYTKTGVIEFIKNNKFINQEFEINNKKNIKLLIQKNIGDVYNRYTFSVLSGKAIIGKEKGNNYAELVDKLDKFLIKNNLVSKAENKTLILNGNTKPEGKILNQNIRNNEDLKGKLDKANENLKSFEKEKLLKDIGEFDKILGSGALDVFDMNLKQENNHIVLKDPKNNILLSLPGDIKYWKELLVSIACMLPNKYKEDGDEERKYKIEVKFNGSYNFIIYSLKSTKDINIRGVYVFNNMENIKANKLYLRNWVDELFRDNEFNNINEICVS